MVYAFSSIHEPVLNDEIGPPCILILVAHKRPNNNHIQTTLR